MRGARYTDAAPAPQAHFQTAGQVVDTAAAPARRAASTSSGV